MATTRRFTRVKTRWFYALMPYKGCEGIFALIFPLFLFNVLHVPISTVGVLSALVSLGAVSGSVLWGYVSDHYHTRRAFIVMGCFLSGVCLMGIGWVTQLVWVALLCMAFGFFFDCASTHFFHFDYGDTLEDAVGAFFRTVQSDWRMGMDCRTDRRDWSSARFAAVVYPGAKHEADAVGTRAYDGGDSVVDGLYHPGT
jgi:MFS family permease